ncbi:hypothetical protein GKZ89_16290 [Bacillus mangrovi]|uniref:Bifunctional metallophosphatase/5'-nucleotidase n=1 Tax=Metabacillus mangrovi TaxID=1491830 RepID=A0A7X2S7B6_9BACI|nr:5'-nucleotidase C-terminal domain-containing protein [Metabacillus mangrovi]MTH54963.1 hypothetical protein [Metabacillus mangrovi]
MYKKIVVKTAIAAAVLSSGLSLNQANAEVSHADFTKVSAHTSSYYTYHLNDLHNRLSAYKDVYGKQLSSNETLQNLKERTSDYKEAVAQGEELQQSVNEFRSMYSNAPDDQMLTSYYELIEETKQYSILITKFRPVVREALTIRYVQPAKNAFQLVSYDMAQYEYLLEARSALNSKNKPEAEKMLKKAEGLEKKDQKLTKTLLKLYPSLKKDAQIIEKNIDAAIKSEMKSIKEALKKPLENFDLSILHSNDTHANVEKAPKRITAIKELRNEKENSLLLDAGDVFSGTLYFNEFKGQPDVELMNLAGYDAMTFGNHEFDLGTAPLARFVQMAQFPFVSANVDFSNDPNMKELYKPEVSSNPEDGNSYNAIIKTINGEKVGILGLTTAETATISSPGDGVAFKNYIKEAEKAVAKLEAKGVNKIVALTHIGFEDGGGDNDVTLAKEVEGLDVIVGGHSHTQLNAPVVDETGEEPTLIVQAYQYSDFLGQLDVEFDYKGKVVAHDGKLIDLKTKTDDAEAVEILNKYKPKVEELKNQVVGSTDVVLDGERANVRTKETNLGNLITDGMLAKAKTIDPETVIALQNGGGIRASINQGDITMGEILTVMPFGNSLAIMELTGKEIKAALEHSVDLAPAQSGAFLQVAGMKFTYDSSKPVGERVTEVQVKEGDAFTALDLEKTYKAATNTFTAAGGDNYTMFKTAYQEGRVSEPGFVDWEIFSTYLKENAGVQPAVEGRITDLKSSSN